MADLKQLKPEEIMALTMWGEARGEPIEGQAAVGFVIWNRVLKMPLDEQNVYSVCLAPKQFSCWNKNDPNYPKLIKLADTIIWGKPTGKAYIQCLYLAHGIIFGNLQDNTKKAVNYMTTELFYSDKRPKWAKFPLTDPRQIGNHTFFTV